METIYCERANGRWEAWTYVDGQRVYVAHTASKGDVIAWATRKGFRFVEVA